MYRALLVVIGLMGLWGCSSNPERSAPTSLAADAGADSLVEVREPVQEIAGTQYMATDDGNLLANPEEVAKLKSADGVVYVGEGESFDDRVAAQESSPESEQVIAREYTLPTPGRTFELRSGELFKGTLTRWLQEDGWKVEWVAQPPAWKVGYDALIEANDALTAVRKVLSFVEAQKRVRMMPINHSNGVVRIVAVRTPLEIKGD